LNDYDKVVIYQKKALEMSHKIKHKELVADTSYNLAITYFELENFEEVVLIPDIEKVYEDLNDKSGLANIFVLKAQLAKINGKFKAERDLLEHALKLGEESQKIQTKINTLVHLATTYMVDPTEFNHAKEYLEEAQELALKYIEPREYMKITINLSTVYLNLGDIEKGKGTIETGLSLARSLKDEETEGMALSQLGSIYFREGDEEKAMHCIDKAQGLCETHSMKRELVQIHRLKGRLFLKKNQISEALLEFDKSFEYIDPYLKNDFSDDTFIWLDQYSDLLASTNKIDEALKVYKDADGQWERLPESYKSSDILNIMYFRIKLN